MPISKSQTLRAILALSTAALLTGSCAAPDTAQDDLTQTKTETYVAFAGGGWRAHTGHASWMIGLLDNQSTPSPMTLDLAFQNVSAISSNSGGSWFNVMLSYSKPFRAGLERQDASRNYLTDAAGYYQLEKAQVNTARTPDTSIFCQAAHLVSDYLAFLCQQGLSWNSVVEDIVFEPLSMKHSLKSTNLNGSQAWTTPKGIVMASTALTQGGVLTSSLAGDKYYYDSSHISPLNVAPVTLSARAKTTDPQLPTFPGGHSNFVVDYKNTGIKFFPPAPAVPKPNNPRNMSSDTLNVITSAAASSAAGGFIASHAIVENNNHTLRHVPLSDWEIAYEGEDLALNFDLPASGSLSPALQRSTSTPRENNQKNKDHGYIKLADGGPLDNSGVAHSVMYHQKNHHASVPFSIIAFDNVTKTYPRRPTTKPMADVGVDIANLFGLGFKAVTNGQAMCVDDLCIKVADNTANTAIFAPSGIVKKHTWKQIVASSSGTSKPCELIYTPYAVTTVKNDMLGIVAGYSGTLHSFTASCPDAGTAPLDAADWTAYEDMFKAIQWGLLRGGGHKYLHAAFH